jgi:hypothetical protein
MAVDELIEYLRGVAENANLPQYMRDRLTEAAAALEAAREEVERLTLEMGRLQQQYDERTACVIVHRGSALACSYDVRTAYSDERRRAERLAELLDQAYGYVPAGTLADQIHCALPRYQEEGK